MFIQPFTTTWGQNLVPEKLQWEEQKPAFLSLLTDSDKNSDPDKLIPKVDTELQRTSNSQNNLGGFILPDLKTYNKVWLSKWY